ncbi:MAG: efflux RND transporter permease subunit [Beijerinckiaceae bacterium]|nr:efflux RND transporter permease subunit [Beijerinckiaceae bacterium]
MNISAPFIARPVATTLLTLGIALAGALAFAKLPVSPLPRVDFPTIIVQANLPGASPETVATSVASPLERRLGKISGVTEMTSASSLGLARIVLQFDISRDINGAGRDVHAAINAARADLPINMPFNPIYRKINPADAPVLILTLTSKTKTRGQMYDYASNVLQQRLSQLEGVGQVFIGGGALPAVRVELNPHALAKYGIGLEDVRAALASANANSPKGAIEDNGRRFQIYTNDQATRAEDYAPLIIAYRNGAPVHLIDVAEVLNSVEEIRSAGIAEGEPAIFVIISRQPGANIIETADRVKAELPRLQAAMPHDIEITRAADRSNTIRASLHHTERTLAIAILLVGLIVLLFLRDLRAALIPVAVLPVSIAGTFAAMYLLDFSLNNLSLMALTIATGFVVDDAIVVLENVNRHIEAGKDRLEAALAGSREVGFTVLSISLSLIAIFIPILFMGGIVGRLFREFAATLSIAILVSLVLSLTLTPMMCAKLLKPRPRGEERQRARFDPFGKVLQGYERSLSFALRHGVLVMGILLATAGLNVYLYRIVPKGFFPQQDTSRIIGTIQADQAISFQALRVKLARFQDILREDPAVDSAKGYIGPGAGGTNSGLIFLDLKPRAERSVSADEIIARLREKVTAVPGARLYLQPVQDIRIGGRPGAGQYQYTLQGESTEELYSFVPRLVEALQDSRIVADVSSDQQQAGLETDVVIDRDTASRLGLVMSQIDAALYNAFGQRQVSTIYSAANQYHVVMEVDPRYWQDPSILSSLYVSTSGASPSGTALTNAVAGTVTREQVPLPQGSFAARDAVQSRTSAAKEGREARNAQINVLASAGRGGALTGSAVSTAPETMIPFSAFSHFAPGHAPLTVNHQGLFVAATLSFNLQPGASLSDALPEIEGAMKALGAPVTMKGSLQGTARAFQESLANEILLIPAALATVYIVLGILYESFMHPLTILSTLFSAGVGAVLALLLFDTEFSIIAMIGVILLIGIVKKNAILMIDFALDAERTHSLSAREAIFRACLLRFRPIVMTTLAATFGAIPLALSFGEGGEIRRPLGIAIIGGLIVSQLLTLYTTPVLYLYLDRFRLWSNRLWRRLLPRLAGPVEAPSE